MQSRSNTDLAGCDLSHYEAGVDMSSTPPIVYLKASEGQKTADSAFAALYDKARAAGRKIGAYHFLHVGHGYSTDAQIDFAVRQLGGRKLDCLYAVDMEEGGYHGGTPDEVTTAVLAFADGFTAKTGLPCCIYTGTAFIREHLTADVERLPLWVADYRNTNGPGDNGVYDNWVGFQYTDKPYDLNAFTSGILIGTADPNICIDTVTCDPDSGKITVTGWAAAGTPVNRVDVYYDGAHGVGNTKIGGARPDVAAVLGSAYPGASTSGFSVTFDAGTIPAGAHTIDAAVIAQDGRSAWASKDATITVPVPGPICWIDSPEKDAQLGNDFVVSGWAVGGADIGRVDLYRDDNVPIGSVSVFGERPDVQKIINPSGFYGDALHSGWEFKIPRCALPTGKIEFKIAAIAKDGRASWAFQTVQTI